VKADEAVTVLALARQIQEREQQATDDKEGFEDATRKLGEELKELEQLDAEVSASLKAKQAVVREKREAAEERKQTLEKLRARLTSEEAAKKKEVDDLIAAADELLRLSQDPEALGEMAELPEFLKFSDDEKPEPVEAPLPQVAVRASRRQKSERGRGRKSTKKKRG